MIQKIVCEINSALPPGIYDIKIKGKKCDEILYEDAFEIFPPVICSIAPKKKGCGSEFIAKGKFFGSDMGGLKVSIGKNGNWQKCKIYGYHHQMTAATGDSRCDFVVPKVKVGTYDVKIENKVGSSVFAGGVSICK